MEEENKKESKLKACECGCADVNTAEIISISGRQCYVCCRKCGKRTNYCDSVQEAVAEWEAMRGD